MHDTHVNYFEIIFNNKVVSKKAYGCNWTWDTIQLLHLNEIKMRFYGAEYNNIERDEAEFNIAVLCSIKPHIDPSSSVVIVLLHKGFILL